jgi:transposase InsO family protein
MTFRFTSGLEGRLLEKCSAESLAGSLPYVKHGFEAERRERSRRLGNESVIGLYLSEVIHRRGPWRHLDDVEYATLDWVDWFNNRRLLEPIGNI